MTFALLAVSIVVFASTAAGSTATDRFTTVDLGTLGGNASAASALTAGGEIVGGAITASGRWHAFSWTREGGMVDLGALGEPFVDSSAVHVNASGQIIGYGKPAGGGDSQRGFFWTQTGGMVDLGTIGADTVVEPSAISSGGQVVGTSWTSGGEWHAFSWQAGNIVELGTLEGTGARANDVSDAGEVVGIAGRGRDVHPGPHAYSWTQSGGMVDLGTLGGSFSEAAAINERRQIVGYSGTPAHESHAFLWTPDGGMTDLGTLGGTRSSAIAISDNGAVAGNSTTSGGSQHAFAWTQSSGMVDLGTLGGSSSQASAISPEGQVVGWSSTSSGAEHAFTWTQRSGMVDLGTLGGNTSRAVAISERGQIVGYAVRPDGTPRAVIWAPPIVKPVIASPSTTPAQPRAGARFTVTFGVTRKDTGTPLTAGKMISDLSIAGKVLLPHTESFKNGVARLSFVIPKTAKGKLLKVKVTIRSGDQSATNVAIFRVR